jgi:hypothetical protein
LPTYNLTCGCGETERWYSIHTGPPSTCATCGGDLTQILTPPVIRSGEGKRIIANDSTLAADRDAYKRLRGDGLQPKGIDGAAVYERHADTQFEVETGYLFPDAAAKKQVAEARKRADEYTQAASGYKFDKAAS